jgi:hypothetical protein
MRINEYVLRPKRVSGIKWLEYIFFVSFLIGIILANLFGKDNLGQFGIFNTYFLKQFQYAKIQDGDLLAYIMEVRTPILFILILTGMTGFWYPLQMIFVVWNGGILGFLCVSGIMNLGPGAILLMGTALFPQYIFYVFMYLVLLKTFNQIHSPKDVIYGSAKESKRFWILFVAGIVIAIFLLGLLSEAYINPFLMKKVIKIF